MFNFPEDNSDGIRFATIRSFKGLETDMVLLIDVVHGSPVCTEADIYVGGSRAKFLLFLCALKQHHPQIETEWGQHKCDGPLHIHQLYKPLCCM